MATLLKMLGWSIVCCSITFLTVGLGAGLAGAASDVRGFVRGMFNTAIIMTVGIFLVRKGRAIQRAAAEATARSIAPSVPQIPAGPQSFQTPHSPMPIAPKGSSIGLGW